MSKSNQALLESRQEAIPRGVGSMHGVFAESAKNAEIWDVEGKRYLDLASGIAVTNTGHNHPEITRAVEEQIHAFSHVCFQVTPYEKYVELAQRLNERAPGTSKKKTIFLTTGAEAVENAVKIARAHTDRPNIISFSGGFHGRTMMGMALTGKVAPYKTGFGPMPGGVYHVPFPTDMLGISESSALEAIERIFKADAAPETVAAIIIEPVQGEGGFYIASSAFMQSLRDICDKHDILLIADEIQTGFARTGKMFAIEHANVEPDLMTVAKAMAGGYPISGVIGKAEIMDAPIPGGLGGTYGGSALGCAAGLAVLDIIDEEKLCERADEIGSRLRGQLEAFRQSDQGIGEVRGLGAMIAIEMVDPKNPDQPDAERTKTIVASARDKGLILLSCGVRGNVIRFLPALTIGFDHLGEAIAILKTVLEETAD
jgi:4-aminobutyrate aminotransferase/(S)-3-amino-2-methylpropionate transaminase